MISLWIAIGLMTVAAAAVLSAAVARGAGQSNTHRADYDITIYKDQLAEVDRDTERGLLTQTEAEAARTEIQRRLLAAADDKEAGEAEVAAAPAGARAVRLGIAILLPAGAIAFYLYLGSPDHGDLPFAGRDLASEMAAQNPAAGSEMDVLVKRLADRLEDDPSNIEGWQLLARTLITMGRANEAVDALRQAMAMAPDRPDIAASYGEALIVVHDGRVTEQALEILETAGKADPMNPIPRYYTGMAKAQAGDTQGALQEWINLVAVSPADAPWLPNLRQQIDEAAGNMGIDASSIVPSAGLPAPPATQAPVTAPGPGPSQEQMEAAAEMSTEDRTAMIRSMVERLAERLAGEPDDLQGWVRLERAYRVLGETDKANEAAKHIQALQQ
jgi:cytochrome c-type biogenesis protein CcmH